MADCPDESRKRPRREPAASQVKSSSQDTESLLPAELRPVDFSKRISWNKYSPYTSEKLPLIEPGREPVFGKDSSPALCHYVNGLDGRARACTIHLHPQVGQRKATPIPTPIFMPVGTKGCLKGLTLEELTSDEALACPIILGNTYHLALQPTTELVDEMGGLHSFQGLPHSKGEYSYNLLTDSGGFQMVSLVKLSEVTEEGVVFENPFRNKSPKDSESSVSDGKDLLLLKPEDSIRHQNNISANIIMALDDVISSVSDNEERFRTATHRTLRWYDRCIKAHSKSATQNLFPIVQGGLDTELGGLREQCLAGFRHRQLEWKYDVPGYAIGGLAGGEEKDQFWRVVDQCCRALPDDKPRYLMGVGYPLDLVVCTALGVDMYDCVYPTRTARFGVALVGGKFPGTLKVKSHDCWVDGDKILLEGCRCQACREGITRARLNMLLKASNPLAVELVTQHNIAYMMMLVREMRQAILEGRFADYAKTFVQEMYPSKEKGGEDTPQWVVEALASAGIHLDTK